MQKASAICINLQHWCISILNMTFWQTMNPCLNCVHASRQAGRQPPTSQTYTYTCAHVACMRWQKILLKYWPSLAMRCDTMRYAEHFLSVINSNSNNIQKREQKTQTNDCSLACAKYKQGMHAESMTKTFTCSFDCIAPSLSYCGARTQAMFERLPVSLANQIREF